MSITSSKPSISRLVKICAAKGLRHVVVSPGSRNAPLTISFEGHGSFECLNIPDERSAAFFALGMAQKLGEPVILCCTSGSAALNYAPAIVEAYYQNIPLIVLTADRPVEWTDQRAGQTIRQNKIFDNYIKKSFQIIGDGSNPEQLWYNDRIVNEAINCSRSSSPGPVHINIPLREPLYDVASFKDVESPKIIQYNKGECILNEDEVEYVNSRFQNSKGVLVIYGQAGVNEEVSSLIEKLCSFPQVIVLTETTSNLKSSGTLQCIDRVIDSISEEEYDQFTPDIVISFGNAIVSKKIRFMLRKMQIKSHWLIHQSDHHIDTYQKLTHNFQITPEVFLQNLTLDKGFGQEETEFKKTWKKREKQTWEAHTQFIQSESWNDLFIIAKILDSIPKGILHMASSTPVRYVQLFNQRSDLIYMCNRGVSGIDGCTSTAAGYSYLSKDEVTLLTGDIAFFYDTNGLWHHYLKGNLKIILINNGGGNIFRYVKGPETTPHLEKHFESVHNTTAQGIASTFGLRYLRAENFPSLHEGIDQLYAQHDRAAILEIFTPRETNIEVLKSYFDHLKTNT